MVDRADIGYFLAVFLFIWHRELIVVHTVWNDSRIHINVVPLEKDFPHVFRNKNQLIHPRPAYLVRKVGENLKAV